ncbi:hypothetical protein [Streptomyces spongiae]|uniref:Uncharacterized protein n=1 Tax=Streptomyces spongiae TaxID=565072 RepID=A0A5N8XD80_9ACTN|nr:hypothetical protein [Streptomyces spongiae]MPY57470.1 hypothetical protein [Streptomyces spongiae]
MPHPTGRTARCRRAPTDLLTALAILTPPLAVTSAVALLVLGHVLQLADVRGALPGSLVTAGWILALVAGLSALLAFAALLNTAIRAPAPPTTRPPGGQDPSCPD